jgi:hypothetical protein
VAREERDGAPKERGRGGRLLVTEHFGVGQARRVVDGDVDIVVANGAPPAPLAVGERRRVVLAAGDAPPRPALDAPQLLDVDMDQLARPRALIALRGLEPDPTQLAQPGPGQDQADRRKRQIEQLGNLRATEAQPPQRADRFDALATGSRRRRPRCRGTIQQPRLSLGDKPPDPLASSRL